MMKLSRLLGIVGLVAAACGPRALAWDYENHRAIALLALQSLPTNFPAFVRTPEAEERIGFLSGEADRWRNSPDLPFRHATGPDHYIDIEELADYGMKPEMLPVFRYDFVAELALFRKANPGKIPPPEPSKNTDHTRELVGLLPWTITESSGHLKSCFSYLKAFEEDGGTADEVREAKANIVYRMGVMSHFAGDAGQPLHTTIHHHGWVGDNPNGYTTNSRIHSWIDGGYLTRVGGVDIKGMTAKLRPAQPVSIDGRPAKPEELLQAVMLFLTEQNKEVAIFYQMEKDGEFSGQGEQGRKGKAYLEKQMLKSAQLLGDLWYSAWVQAPPDTFLKGQLARRKGVQSSANK
jgi:hypothetical protein